MKATTTQQKPQPVTARRRLNEAAEMLYDAVQDVRQALTNPDPVEAARERESIQQDTQQVCRLAAKAAELDPSIALEAAQIIQDAANTSAGNPPAMDAPRLTYPIHEANAPRLIKKLARIANKCAAYGVPFELVEAGEAYEEDADGTAQRYVLVHVQGVAKVSGWEFVATLEHLDGANVIRTRPDAGIDSVPEKFRTCQPVCEHCNSSRRRKDTYIIRNTSTGEYRQVGRNCLADYTSGLSAEAVAQYISLYDELIKGQAAPEGRGASYYNTAEFVAHAAETVRIWGYVPKAAGETCTSWRAFDNMQTYNGIGYNRESVRKNRAELDAAGYDIEQGEAAAAQMLEWLAQQEPTSDYIHNLQTIAAQEWHTCQNQGVLASLPQAYQRAQEREADRRRREQESQVRREQWEQEHQQQAERSGHVGAIGERIKFTPAAVRVATSWQSCYDGWNMQTTRLYIIEDEGGNVYSWRTTAEIAEDAKAITATVKAHEEYKGIAQTVITRARVSY